MSDLRTVAQQALKAMEKATRFMTDADYRKLNEAIEVLKDALAEPVQEQDEYDSPERRCGGPGCDMTCCQPVQEPVAWGWRSADGQIRDCLSSADYASGEGEYTIPLYTAPPQRKPLDAKQLEQIMAECFAEKGVPTDWWDWRIKDFVRAIERAHGIGGNDE